MPPQFLIHLDRDVRRADGAHVATSADGSAVVAVLGHVANPAARAAQILAAVPKEGPFTPPRSIGDTGYVVCDRRTGTTAVVAAEIGISQIYWASNSSGLWLASEPAKLQECGVDTGGVSAQGLYQYVYFHCIPGPGSFFPGVKKLDGGHVLHWAGDQAQVSRYWRPEFNESESQPLAAASAHLHEELRKAVERAMGNTASVGAFLSGGLDSSTVSGVAARIRPQIPTISMGFDAAGYDEMEYARCAASHFKTRPLEYYVTPEDVLSTLPSIAAAFPEPFGNSSAAAVYQCARVARENGIELLLAGDGGDEIFGGNERYAKQLVFERYGQVPRPVRAGLIEPLVAGASRMTTAFLVGKARSYIAQANVPLPDRLQSYNFLHRHDPSEIFSPDLLAAVDKAAPLQLLREEYNLPKDASAVNRMLFLDWKFTLHDNDLVKVNTMCHLAGVNVAYPMLDPSLIDFSMTVPATWKVRDGELRWFYKRAMESFLPDKIINKSKHGFGLPFGVWTRSHAGLRALAKSALDSLGRRGFFRAEFLENALRLHEEAHAGYYGELVWIFTVLELWLQARMPNARL